MTIKPSQLKDDICKILKDEGIYGLEKIFGIRCRGHGSGFGGEDIDFLFADKQWIFFYRNDRRILVEAAYEGDKRAELSAKNVEYITRKLLKKD